MLLRLQATLLLLLATAVASGALAAWALAPVQEGPAATTPLQTFGTVSRHGGFLPPFDGGEGEDGKGKRRMDYCPRGVQVAAGVECPPHKTGIHYEKYSLREYYGGARGRRRRGKRERERRTSHRRRGRDAREINLPSCTRSTFKTFKSPRNRRRRLGHHQDPVCAPGARCRERCALFVFC